MRLIQGEVLYYLPSLGMVFAQSVAEVLVPARVDPVTLFGVHVDLLRVLLEVRNILGGVSALEDGVGS